MSITFTFRHNGLLGNIPKQENWPRRLSVGYGRRISPYRSRMIFNLDINAVPIEDIPRVIGELEMLQVQLQARLMAAAVAPAPQADENDDEMLTTAEAAKLLRRSPRWLYRNAHRLPFVRRLSRKSMLHSKRGIERYLARRAA